jgi:hypothetical protein
MPKPIVSGSVTDPVIPGGRLVGSERDPGAEAQEDEDDPADARAPRVGALQRAVVTGKFSY